MTTVAKLEPLLGILLGIGVLILAHFFPDVGTELKVVGGALLTSGMPQVSQLMKPNPNESGRTDSGRRGDSGRISGPVFVLVAWLAAIVGFAIALPGCASTGGQTLVTNLKACVAVNPENQAEKTAILECIGSALLGDPAECLACVPESVAWSWDEVVCLARVQNGATVASATATPVPVAKMARAALACPVPKASAVPPAQ